MSAPLDHVLRVWSRAVNDCALTRRRLLAALLGGTAAAALGATVPACSGADSSVDADDLLAVDVQLSWLKTVGFAGTYLADHRGYFADEGLKVMLRPGGPNVLVPAIVAEGGALVGMASTDVTAAAAAQGEDLRIIGARFQKSPFTVVSLENRPVRGPDDLRGLVVGVSPTNDLAFTSFLAINGISEAELRKVPIQFDVEPLITGDVDALLGYFTAQPNIIRSRGISPVTMLLADYGFDLFENVYIVREADLDARRSTIERFMRGERRGWADAISDPDAAVAATMDVYAVGEGLDRASQQLEARSQAELIVSPATDRFGLFWMSEDAIERNLRTLGRLGMTVDSDLFDTSVLGSL